MPANQPRPFGDLTSTWPTCDTAPGNPQKTGLVYRGIVWWGALLVRTYHRVEIVGPGYPEHAPTLAVQNHSNGLCDAHILMCTTDRPLRILVKYKLIHAPLIGWMLRQMQAVPVYRRKDGVDTRKNAQSFEAIDQALMDGSVVALFPEGESLDSIGLRELRSGVGRMAMSAHTSSDRPLGLVVVPVGVTYENRDRLRCLASAIVGAPIEVAPILDRAASTTGDDASPRAGIQALMDEVSLGLQRLILHAETREEYDAAVALERLLETSGEPLGLRRKEALVKLRSRQDGEEEARRRVLCELGERLSAARLTGDDVLRDAPSLVATLRPTLLWLPLWLVALPFWIPIAALAVFISRFPKTPDKVVTLRVLFGYAGLVLLSIAVPLLGLGLWGWKGALLGTALFWFATQVFVPATDGLLQCRAKLARRALDRDEAERHRLQDSIRSIREAYHVVG